MTDQPGSAGPTTLSREKLYELVWKTPMIRLAEQFGISDVGLRKICKRLDIPSPPAGWWAKKAAGKAVKVKPLPQWRPGIPKQATIAPTPDQEEGLRRAVAQQVARIEEITVPDRLPRPHPLIAGWIAGHRRRQQEARRERDPWRRKLHTVPDLTPAERRRHRVLHALFRALEKNGATIGENQRRQLTATISGEEIAFVVHEKSRQVTRPLTAEEKRWETWNRSGVKKELEPTGRFEIKIETWTDQRLRKTWLETDRNPFEALLPQVVATLLVLGPILAGQRRQREEQARILAERQRQAELEQQQKQQDDNRFRRLLDIAEGWKRAELARDFIARLRELELPEAEPVEGRSLSEWLDWAEAKATQVDPVGQGIERIFADVAQVSAWTYRDR
ncbi:MAG TPA: hypothetical protein VNH53_06885 [Sphingomicrobium sp.]|nr:hypothetical protein [Sphingomicrobium sp.]